MSRAARRGQIDVPPRSVPGDLPMRWLLPTVAALALALPARADEPKPAPPTAAEIKKQIADLEAVIKKKEAEFAKGKEEAKKLDDEGKKLAEARDKKLKELFDAADKALAPQKEKAAAVKEKAVKIRKAAKEFADAHNALIAKYKASTDPKEQEELGKKINEEKETFKIKLEELKKAETTAKAAEDEYLKAADVRKAEIDQAARAADVARLPLLKEQTALRSTLTKIQDELDAAHTHPRN